MSFGSKGVEFDVLASSSVIKLLITSNTIDSFVGVSQGRQDSHW